MHQEGCNVLQGVAPQIISGEQWPGPQVMKSHIAYHYRQALANSMG